MQIVRFDGRAVDSLLRHDGTRLSPYALTAALEDIAELRRYQVIQRDRSTFNVILEAGVTDRELVASRATRAIKDLIGGDLSINIEFRTHLVGDGTRKFRPVACHATAS